MRKDVREFIRRLEAAGLTVESTPGHYHVLRDGKPLRKANGMPFTLPFSPTRPGGAGQRSSTSAGWASTSSLLRVRRSHRRPSQQFPAQVPRAAPSAAGTSFVQGRIAFQSRASFFAGSEAAT